MSTNIEHALKVFAFEALRHDTRMLMKKNTNPISRKKLTKDEKSHLKVLEKEMLQSKSKAGVTAGAQHFIKATKNTQEKK